MKHSPSTTPSAASRAVPAKKAVRAATHVQAATQPHELARDAQREAMIRQAAYLRYESRGCVYGHELEDWLKAEAQVDAELAQAVRALASAGR